MTARDHRPDDVIVGPAGVPLRRPFLSRHARSLLMGGQVQVLEADGEHVRAEAFDHPRGAAVTTRHVVTFNGSWACTCTRAGRCPHQQAVQAVSALRAAPTEQVGA